MTLLGFLLQLLGFTLPSPPTTTSKAVITTTTPPLVISTPIITTTASALPVSPPAIPSSRYSSTASLTSSVAAIISSSSSRASTTSTSTRSASSSASVSSSGVLVTISTVSSSSSSSISVSPSSSSYSASSSASSSTGPISSSSTSVSSASASLSFSSASLSSSSASLSSSSASLSSSSASLSSSSALVSSSSTYVPSSSSSISSSSSSISSSSSSAPGSSSSSISSSSASSTSSTASSSSSSSATSTPSAGPITVSGQILVFARDSASAYSATSGLSGHGIPYQLVIVPQEGASLPVLNSTAIDGNYGGIIVLGEVSYSYTNGFASALTAAQWQQMYDYQTSFGVRMVRLDAFPSAEFGATTAIAGSGCCNAGVEQLLSFSNTTGFPTAGLVLGATVSTQGLWHYPATITDSSTTWEVAQFGPGGSFTTTTTAAVINKFGTRQQMVWFTSFATDWSTTSTFIQHSYIHWVTRGLFAGRRRVFLGTQVDDMHLSTTLYSPANTEFRLRPADIAAHASWTTDLNSRLPAGSNYFMEIGHNGNGDIMVAVTTTGSSSCNPGTAIEFDEGNATALEFQKPLGSGTDIWPATPVAYSWSLTCASNDDLAKWFMIPANRDAFAHISHTFAHESLNNATYSDANREIFFNKQWMSQVGISAASKFSAKGLIPPAITGLHNGDAIKAFMDNGITAVVGDNTRPVLKNQQNEFWPLVSTVAGNGYDGLLIIPRWATTIFYNCDLPACTTLEWVTTSGGSGDFTALLADAKAANTRHLLGLHHDPFMFHQANLRQSDVPISTVGSQTGRLSLIQIWVETITQEMARLTTWPLISITHDNIALEFTNRMARDGCAPTIKYTLSADATTIESVLVGANGNSCSVPIPITLPVDATTTASGTTSEKIGSDPVVKWSTLSGSAVTWKLSTPVAI